MSFDLSRFRESQDLEGAIKHLNSFCARADITMLDKPGSLVRVRGMLLDSGFADAATGSTYLLLANPQERSFVYCIDVQSKFFAHYSCGRELTADIAADGAIQPGNQVDVWGVIARNNGMIEDRPEKERIIDVCAFVAHPYRGHAARVYYPVGFIEQRPPV